MIELCPYNVNFSKTLKDFLHNELNLSNQQIKEYLKSKQRQSILSRCLKLDANLLNRYLVNPIYNGEKIYLSEDDDFIYIEKPPGVFSQPLKYNDSNNCLSFLRSISLGKYLNDYNDSWEKGLLYRIDHVTSGLLIYAKNKSIHESLRENFNQIAKKKTYLCIVEGEWNIKDNDLCTKLAPFKNNTLMRESEEGEVAKLTVKKLISFDSMSLLQINLSTGLRHQIRAQLSNAGCPIVGDVEYGAAKNDRVYLHAFHYEIKFGDKIISKRSEHFLKENLFEKYLNKFGGVKTIL